VQKARNITTVAFWVVMPCELACGYKRLRKNVQPAFSRLEAEGLKFLLPPVSVHAVTESISVACYLSRGEDFTSVFVSTLLQSIITPKMLYPLKPRSNYTLCSICFNNRKFHILYLSSSFDSQCTTVISLTFAS
jgi:hypothetical protein